MDKTKSITSASSTIPAIFRILLLYAEPFCAFAGALLVLIKPENYVSTMTRDALTRIDPSSKFIYTELAGGWFHFAFTEAIVLRALDDVRAWRLLCVGMLLSDLAYTHSCAQAVGGWAEWVMIWHWTSADWIVTITTWPFVLVRLAIVLGIGMQDPQSKAKKMTS